jgi:uncharacterized membrane protein YjgN (DUF898 family)
MGLTRRRRLSEDDKRFYRRVVAVAVLTIFGIMFLVAMATTYTQWACIQLAFGQQPAPAGCSNMGKFVLEFVGLVVGVLGAIKLLGLSQ